MCASPFALKLRQNRRRLLVRLIITISLLIPLYLLLTFFLPRPTTLTKTPLLALNFPDPCIIQDMASGTWYAFATGSWTPNTSTDTTASDTTTTPPTTTYKHIQAASAAHPTGPWTYLPSADPLPTPGPWTAGPGSQTWSPSLTQLTTNTTPTNPTTTTTTPTNTNTNTTYILYYSAQLPPPHTHIHCIGAATSPTSILGPYTPLPEPILCPLPLGGAIDPSAFRDPADGRRYLLYKVDGNALGGGGECNNGVAPFRRTPIVLQEVDGADGVGLVGGGVEVLDRVGEVDGALVEAPELVWVSGGDGGGGDKGGRYVLFYSNHCWDGPGYSVNYAVSEENITGPYKRAEGPLIRTGDAFNVTAPGGAVSVPGGGWMLFHGNCPEGRCLFGAEMKVVGSTVTVS
ncbi:glycoside hydrolase family 43 protein [Chaetomium fimeti]|uniref:Glycoside hydrolase family 43 protein n=1 Tax=Chaetomium fimeti TaxID=1854472 RepID=A0AAE0LVL6_9PEZI|nr:glycoside hydrolase family 43 protein [Chaetomium fimeti]